MSKYQAALNQLVEQYFEPEQDFCLKHDGTTFAKFVARELFEIEAVKDGVEISPSGAYALGKYAETDYEVFDLAVQICSLYILRGDKLPYALRTFSAKVLDGELKRPSPKHREPKPEFSRHLRNYQMLVTATHIHGLRLSRNDVSDATSACDAVSEVLTANGEPTSYTELKDLCFAKQKAKVRERILQFYHLVFGDSALTLENINRPK